MGVRCVSTRCTFQDLHPAELTQDSGHIFDVVNTAVEDAFVPEVQSTEHLLQVIFVPTYLESWKKKRMDTECFFPMVLQLVIILVVA